MTTRILRFLGGCGVAAALMAGCNLPVAGLGPSASVTPIPPPAEGTSTLTPSETPTASETVEPTPTVVHVTRPGEPTGLDRFLTDVSSGAYASEKRAPGEDFGRSRLERPFQSQTMDYQGHVDIVRAELKVGEPWIYVSVFLEETAGAADAVYAVELDLDADGRGDWLIAADGPPGQDWTTNGVRAYQDQNNDVGGVQPLGSEPPPQSGNGYETLIFDQGQGADPDAAWTRLSPGGAGIQIAFKTNLLDGAGAFLWGVWAQAGPMHPEWFDYNDHYSLAQAGSPLAASADYPVKELAAVDSTCRDAYLLITTGLEPGLCQLPASISGLVWKDRCLLTGGEGGDPLVLGQGCISTPNAPYWNSDGVFEPSWEPGIAGIVVDLGAGSCPATGLATDTTDSAGGYSFGGLSAGTYCVSIGLFAHGNDADLIPGGWRVPSTSGTVAEYTITLISGQNKAGVNFAWLFQFGD